jgi:hypothetical protein
MRISEIFEAVRPSVLYHGTSGDAAEKILRENTIQARTTHHISLPYGSKRPDFRDRDRDTTIFPKSRVKSTGNYVKGVSLTRDPRFAKKWTAQEGVVFCFDADKIRNRLRVVPFNFQYEERIESEEFVIGTVEPVDKLLINILISRETYEIFHNFYENNKTRYELLINHPLLKIEDWGSGKLMKAAA